MRHVFSFLIWDLRCAWHMRVGFECFLMTMQKDSSVPRFHSLEGEGNKPNHFPPTLETTPSTLLQRYRQGLGRGRRSTTGTWLGPAASLPLLEKMLCPQQAFGT